MNKANFISYLNNSNSFNSTTEKELKELTESFPYFQTGQSLYLKSLHSNESIHFDNQLKIAAVHTPNRAALYYLLNSETIQVEKKKETEKLKVSTSKKKDKLETEILNSAINASITQEVISELEQLPVISSSTEIEPIKEFKQPTPFQSNEKHTFSEWLKNAKAPEQFVSQPEEKDEDIIEEKTTDNTQFFSPTKMAKKSLVDKNEFVSETLANIYYAQANFEKALDAYRKLSLKFPEKKTYFASQIEIIENKIKNSK